MASNSLARQIYSSASVTNEQVVTLKKTEVGGTTQLVGQDEHRRSKRRRRKLDDSYVAAASKWRLLPLSETGFAMSLLPRRPMNLKDDNFNEIPEHDRCNQVPAAPHDVQVVRLVDGNHSSELNMLSMTSTGLATYAGMSRLTYWSNDAEVDGNCAKTSVDVYEVWLECLQQEPYDDVIDFDNNRHNDKWRQYGESVEEQTTNRPLRAKKKWRVVKARRQLKTPNCRSVSNCAHGVSLCVSHRIFKRMTMVIQPTSHRPCLVTLRRIDKEKAALITQNGKRQLTVASKPTPIVQQKAVVHDEMSSNATSTLLYAVNTCNADSTLSHDVVSLLVALQHRDLEPNDYELLLRLDDRIQPLTVSELQLSSLPVSELSVADIDRYSPINCGVCLESVEVGQRLKHLHCGHSFHDICIDAWLRKLSTKCPLDGLEVLV